MKLKKRDKYYWIDFALGFGMLALMAIGKATDLMDLRYDSGRWYLFRVCLVEVIVVGSLSGLSQWSTSLGAVPEMAKRKFLLGMTLGIIMAALVFFIPHPLSIS